MFRDCGLIVLKVLNVYYFGFYRILVTTFLSFK